MLTCEDIYQLGIQWPISNTDTVKSWNDLSSTNSYSCDSRDDIGITIVSFSAPSFKQHTNYYWHLSTFNKIRNNKQISVRAAIQHEDGIATHYLFMDQALAGLLGGVLLLVSLICFLLDLLLVCSYRKKHI